MVVVRPKTRSNAAYQKRHPLLVLGFRSAFDPPFRTTSMAYNIDARANCQFQRTQYIQSLCCSINTTSSLTTTSRLNNAHKIMPADAIVELRLTIGIPGGARAAGGEKLGLVWASSFRHSYPGIKLFLSRCLFFRQCSPSE